MEIKYSPFIVAMLFIIVMIISCKKSSVDTDISAEPVVIAYLSPGQPISVKIYTQKDLADTAVYGAPITGLSLSVSDGAKSLALPETATGTYTASDNGFLLAGKTYTLSFNYNSLPVTASTVMPGKPTGYTSSATTLNLPLGTANTNNNVALTFRWTNPDSLNHVLVFKNDDSSPFNVHPQVNSPFNFTFNTNKAATYQVYYRSLNYIGIYRVTLYRVNQEYIDLLNSSTTSTSKNLNNPPTNVKNGLGIFTAVQADTIKLTVTQY